MFLYKQNFDLIKISGKDSLSFLNRLTTNLCLSVMNNQIIQSSVLNSKGKILDLINIFIQNHQLYFLTSYNSSPDLINHLNKYIVTDDIELNFIKSVNCSIDNELNQNKNNYYSGYFNNSINIDFQSTSLDNSNDEMNLYTIQNGVPCFSTEINSSYSPQDINLDFTISKTKGCYLGQEVIARSETYNKIKYHLCYIQTENELMNNYIFENNQIAIKTRQFFKDEIYHSLFLVVKNKSSDLLELIEKKEIRIILVKEY